MSHKKLPRLNPSRSKNDGGFTWDNGNIAFGDPMDALLCRSNHVRLEKYYRDLYPKEKKAKCRKNILRKNELLNG
jgi:hypothetical protein